MMLAVALLWSMPVAMLGAKVPPLPPGQMLLSTKHLAAEISTVRILWEPHVVVPDPETFKARSIAVRRDVDRFVIEQINAYPGITECELQRSWCRHLA